MCAFDWHRNQWPLIAAMQSIVLQFCQLSYRRRRDLWSPPHKQGAKEDIEWK